MIFERIEARVVRAARRRAAERADQLAERLGTELPRGVSATRVAGGVRLSGPGLARRLSLDPALRWISERLR
jgi:hypothetical protein